VCAHSGLWGATTREIAAAAGVNEVTLFRHFGSKEKLIAALVERAVAAHVEALRKAESFENDLGADLRRFAREFQRLLNEHEPLIRTLIGEAHQHPKEAKRLVAEAAQPLRQRLRDYLAAAQKAGAVREDLALEPAVDCLTGMLLAELLRRTGKAQTMPYTAAEFSETALEIFVRGIEAPGRHGRRRG
jgi:AcrR family transcriptional regulator